MRGTFVKFPTLTIRRTPACFSLSLILDHSIGGELEHRSPSFASFPLSSNYTINRPIISLPHTSVFRWGKNTIDEKKHYR